MSLKVSKKKCQAYVYALQEVLVLQLTKVDVFPERIGYRVEHFVLIFDVTERELSVAHQIQYHAHGPHVRFLVDLEIKNVN
jgi:hypothetical protein